MTPAEFRASLEALGWTQEVAARRLGCMVKGKPNAPRVNDWCAGRRRVPGYIASNVRVHLELRDCQKTIRTL